MRYLKKKYLHTLKTGSGFVHTINKEVSTESIIIIKGEIIDDAIEEEYDDNDVFLCLEPYEMEDLVDQWLRIANPSLSAGYIREVKITPITRKELKYMDTEMFSDMYVIATVGSLLNYSRLVKLSKRTGNSGAVRIIEGIEALRCISPSYRNNSLNVLLNMVCSLIREEGDFRNQTQHHTWMRSKLKTKIKQYLLED